MSYTNIFDSHAHYDDEAFDADRETVLAQLPQKGIRHVIDCGANLSGCQKAVELAQKYSYIHAAVGIHPEEIGDSMDAWLPELEAMLRVKEKNKIVAVGEIGLDWTTTLRKTRRGKYRNLPLPHSWNLPPAMICR